jgi:hypothetical protein
VQKQNQLIGISPVKIRDSIMLHLYPYMLCPFLFKEQNYFTIALLCLGWYLNSSLFLDYIVSTSYSCRFTTTKKVIMFNNLFLCVKLQKSSTRSDTNYSTLCYGANI